MKTIFILSVSILLLLFPASGNAQTQVILEDVSSDTAVSKKTIEGGIFFDITFVGGFNQPGLNRRATFGFTIQPNVKFNLSKKIALVLPYGYQYELYSVKKTGNNNSFPFPDSAGFENNQFVQSALKLGLGIKYQFNTRWYLQLGAIGRVNFSNRYMYETENDKGDKFSVVLRNPDYFNNVSYDTYLRIGVKGIGIVAYYRMSDMFKKSNTHPTVVYETPRLRLGVGFGL